ncbi:EAL domain-containing protein [Oscillospiraceae bacterium PP1C4]
MHRSAKKDIVKTGAMMALFAVVIIFSALYYVNAVSSSLEETTREYLQEIAWQNASTVKKQVEGDFQMLQAMAGFIGGQKDFLVAPNMDILTEQVSKTSFKRMGLILPNGTAYTTDDMNMMAAEQDFFKRGMEGESTVSETISDKTDGEKVYVYETPVYHNGHVVAVLFATSRAQTYSSLLDVTLFGEEAYSFITNRDGGVIVHSRPPQRFMDIENIFNKNNLDIAIKSNELSKMQDDMCNRRSGVVEFIHDGRIGYINYTWINVNDWYVISAVSADVVVGKSDYLIGLALAVCITTMVIFLGLFAYILYAQNHHKQELERLAYTDEVTGGYNWSRFIMAARSVLNKSGDQEYAMIIFDIDKFKVFNDLFGHPEGNRIMQHIWMVLRENVGKDEPFARVSADNFNILMKYESDEEVEYRIKKIVERIENFGEASSIGHSVKLSFGVYYIVNKTLSVSLMSDRADIARKTIKGNHERMIAFYDQGIRDRILAEKSIENEMVEALENGEFEVYLQPKYSIATRGIVGAEALVRWNHPERGMVPPGEFIPVFEKNGFVVKIDRFVLERICEKQRDWMEQGLKIVPVSVNISRMHLHNPEFTQNTIDTVQKYEIPCGLIELELTESAMLDFENTTKLIDIINKLKAEGFTLAMDDFGTGYSSLNVLRRLPVDVLKLDREFFGTDTDSRRGETVISDVVAMANHLDITVVAEGVETKEQVDFLSTIGCDIVQGYYFAKPTPIERFEKLCAASN